MDIIISHKTAFNQYRKLRACKSDIISKDKIKKLTIPESFNNKKSHYLKSQIANNECSKNFEVLISDINKKYNLNGIKIRISKLNYPDFSFLKIGDHIYMPSPELMFYQLSRCLSLDKLIVAGMEICGTYSFCEDEDFPLMFNLAPITTKNQICTYLKNLSCLNKQCPGVNTAMKAASQISENSASPQESRLFIMLCGNRSIGAYGIKNMILNYNVDMSRVSADIAQQKIIIPDICNPDKKIAIEYDSSSFHDNVAQNQKDKLRSDALQHDGWKVFSFVASHTRSVTSFHHMAVDILKANGQRPRFEHASFFAKRDSLFNNLYNS